MRRSKMIVALFLTSMVCALARAEPTTKPAGSAEEASVTTRTRLLDFPAVTYFYASVTTTIPEMGPVVHDMMEKLRAASKEGQVEGKGAPIFVYIGITQDLTKPFELQIGRPVVAGTKEVGEFKVRELPAMRAATVLFSGPTSELHGAYEQAFPDLAQAGAMPSGEVREMILYWEKEDSTNNVHMIQIGVK